ncbi:MAG: Ig-like domain-containing protein, partial [Muribaculaceae bacterium]|nr:Ig-like domain-containing protein [Muribaculaceae bacterium]
AAQRWESSNPEVATVDDNGNVTAVKPGTAIVTYTMTDSNGATYSDTCTVTVGENSAVDEISADTFDSSEPADVYTLSGILVKSGATPADIAALPAGLYILRQGPTAKKIAVK